MAGNNTTSSGLGTFALVVAGVLAVVVGVTVYQSSANSEYEVIFEVEWEFPDDAPDVPYRTQDIRYAVVGPQPESDTLLSVEGSPWVHITTAQYGDTLKLSSVQSSNGPLKCRIIINGEEEISQRTDTFHGCSLQYTI